MIAKREILPDADVAPGVMDGEVDGFAGHKAKVTEQRVSDLHPGDEGLARHALEFIY